MARSALAPILAAMIAATPVAPVLAQEATTYDNLTRIQSSRFDVVYLAPGADFRGFTKIMLDPTEVAFHRNFQRDFNRSTVSLASRVRDADVERWTGQARTGFERVFRETYQRAGYQIVTEPGPDVLRVRTAVLDLFVTAPDVRRSGRSRTYSSTAGQATLVLEVRDSVSGAILGRAVDRRIAGDMTALRNNVSNQADFERVFRTWAQRSVDGLGELRERSPIPGGEEPAEE